MATVATLRKTLRPQSVSLFLLALLVFSGLWHFKDVSGDKIPERSLELSSSIASATANYSLSFMVPNTEILGSVTLTVCANDPIIGDPCDAPTGLDMTNAVLNSQEGPGDFSILSSTANEVILTRTAGSIDPVILNFELTGITNPSAAGSYYGRIETFATEDATDTHTDYGGLAFGIDNSLTVSVTVPPYLYFCVGITISGTDCSTTTGNSINLGELSAKTAVTAESQMVAGTNAPTGYDIIMSGATMTSGNNEITALTTANVSKPGTSQFGLNLVANQDPSVGLDPQGPGTAQPASGYDQSNLYRFTSNDKIASVSQPDAPRNFTVSYLVNISSSQPAGIYVSTVTYVCTAQF